MKYMTRPNFFHLWYQNDLFNLVFLGYALMACVYLVSLVLTSLMFHRMELRRHPNLSNCQKPSLKKIAFLNSGKLVILFLDFFSV